MIDIPDSIFPKNDRGEILCPRCHVSVKQCSCPDGKQEQEVRVRLDRSGRNGKTVTIISGLPPEEEGLKKITKLLKSKTGSGGTHYIQEGTGVIEVQGDQRSRLPELLKNEGFICTG